MLIDFVHKVRAVPSIQSEFSYKCVVYNVNHIKLYTFEMQKKLFLIIIYMMKTKF